METRAEPVADKSKAVLCEFFLAGARNGGNTPQHTATQKKALAAFSALFDGKK